MLLVVVVVVIAAKPISRDSLRHSLQPLDADGVEAVCDVASQSFCGARANKEAQIPRKAFRAASVCRVEQGRSTDLPTQTTVWPAARALAASWILRVGYRASAIRLG